VNSAKRSVWIDAFPISETQLFEFGNFGPRDRTYDVGFSFIIHGTIGALTESSFVEKSARRHEPSSEQA
jgi:hypothetical protein